MLVGFPVAFYTATLGLFVASLVLYVHHLTVGHIRHLSPTIGVVLTGLGVLCTIAAGVHGWMLVQDHHVGVRPISDVAPPRQEMRRAG